MSDNNLGHTVVDGHVRYFSVSSLEKAGSRENGCFRRYWYRYVGGKSAEEKTLHEEAKARGDSLHAELAHYLRTGERSLSALAMRGLHFVPPPNAVLGAAGDVTRSAAGDLIVERSLHTIDNNGIIHSPLTAAGTPVVGFIDCAHTRGINYGTEDPSERFDPPGTIELLDWKRKGKDKDRNGLSTLLRPEQLVKTIQMSGYGMWAYRAAGFKSIRLSHGYFIDKGAAPRKVTKLHVIDDCARTWEYVEGVARSIHDVVKETIAERVPANVRACEVYGGCPHREYCTAYKTTSIQTGLAELFGESQETVQMGFIDQLGGTPPSADIGTPNMLQQLEAEEAAQRAAHAARNAPPVPAPAVPAPMAVHPLAALWTAIKGREMGYPTLSGDAAKVFAAASGVQLGPDGTIAGDGRMKGLNLFSVDQIKQLAFELKLDVDAICTPRVESPPIQVAVIHNTEPSTVCPMPGVTMQPPAPTLFAPDAPQSIPALAAKVDAPTAPSAPTATTPTATTPTASAPADKPKRPRGRPRSQPASADAPQIAAAPPPPPVAVSQVADQLAAPIAAAGAGTGLCVDSDAPLEVYVDCTPNVPTTSLYDYVDKLLGFLTSKYCFDDQGRPTPPDIRCAPESGPLGFGRWKGFVHALVIQNPPPRGPVRIDTHGNEIYAVVADAMRVVCAQRDGLYVRGVR